MRPEHLFTTLASFALTWSIGALLAFFLPRQSDRRRPWMYAALSLLMVLAVVWVNSKISLGRNGAVYFIDVLRGGGILHWAAAGLGFCFGLIPALWPWQSEWSRPTQGWSQCICRASGLLAILGTFLLLVAFALEAQLKPFLVNRELGSILSNPGAFYCDPDFVLEEYHVCEFHPVQIAIGPQGNLFATGYLGVALQRGIVGRLDRDHNGNVAETIVARNLSRPHGLAFHQGNMYVSRSGQYSPAVSGILQGVNTGAVTLVRDLDNDNIMDHYEDIVVDLPGAQGPDPLHQNNGITFGPDEWLYITIGAHSDHSPPVGPLEGTIVRCRPDGSEQEVFASGLRNPFDVVVGPDNELFCTDNDPSERGRGDEFNHVMKGRHYGFPYTNGSQPHLEGTVPPLWVHRHGSLQGVTYADSSLLPQQFQKCFYVVSYGSGEVWRISVERNKHTYRAEAKLFVRIPQSLDIVAADDGSFYVSCFWSKKIYRISPKKRLP